MLCGLLLGQHLQIGCQQDLLCGDRLNRADQFFFRHKLVGAAAVFQLCGVVRAQIVIMHIFPLGGHLLIAHQRPAAVGTEHKALEQVFGFPQGVVFPKIRVIGRLCLAVDLLHPVKVLLRDQRLVGVFHHSPLVLRQHPVRAVGIELADAPALHHVAQIDLAAQDVLDGLHQPRLGLRVPLIPDDALLIAVAGG